MIYTTRWLRVRQEHLETCNSERELVEQAIAQLEKELNRLGPSAEGDETRATLQRQHTNLRAGLRERCACPLVPCAPEVPQAGRSVYLVGVVPCGDTHVVGYWDDRS